MDYSALLLLYYFDFLRLFVKILYFNLKLYVQNFDIIATFRLVK